MRVIVAPRTAWTVLALSVCLVAQALAQGGSAPTIDAEIVTAPVVLDGVAIFRVRGVSSYPADTRAAVISARIAAAAADRSIGIDALRAIPVEHTIRIDAGTQPLMAVGDADAALEQVSQAELATAHLSQLKQAIADYRQRRTPQALWHSGGRTLAATIVLAIGITALLWLWRWVDGLMERRVQSRIQALGLQSSEVARAEQIRTALQGMLFGVRVVAFVALALAYVGYVLAQWPATRALSHGTFGLALDPLRALGAEFVGAIPQLAFLLVLYVILRMALRVLHLFFDAIGRGTLQFGNFDREWALPTYKIVRLLVVAFGLIVAYPYIPGSNSDAFKGVSLFIGVVFSLGSSSAIGNIIAGYMMTYRRAFKVGDLVQIGNATGTVIEMRLQVTHLRNYRNEEIIIPNSQILTSDVVNFSSLEKIAGSMVCSQVGIGYETSWRKVQEILLEAAGRTAGLASAPNPFVLVKSLGDFSVTYELNAPLADARTRIMTSSLLNRNVLDVFNEHGIQIMTPAYEADPPEPKIAPVQGLYPQPAPVAAASLQPETVAPGSGVV